MQLDALLTIFLLFLPGIPLAFFLSGKERKLTVSYLPITFVLSYSIIALTLDWISTLGISFDLISSTTALALVLVVLIIISLKNLKSRSKLTLSWDNYSVAALIFAFLFLLFGWSQLIAPNYLVPPGDDAAAHAIAISRIIETENVKSAGQFIPYYPVGFHLAVAWVSLFGGASITEVMQILNVIILPISVLAMFSLVSEIFDNRIAMLSSFLYLFSTTLLWTINDGSVVLVIAFCILLPMAFYFLFRFLHKGLLLDAFLSSIIFSAGLVSHPYFLFFIGILAIFVFIMQISFRIPNLIKKLIQIKPVANSYLLQIIFVIFVTSLLSLYPAWSQYLGVTFGLPSPQTQLPLALLPIPSIPWINTSEPSSGLDVLTSPQDLPLYSVFYLGPPIILLSFIGLALTPLCLRKTSKYDSFVFLFSWFAASCILSFFRFNDLNFSLLELPGFYSLQFTRFIFMPLLMFGALSLDFLIYNPVYGVWSRKSKNKFVSTLILVFVIVTSSYVVWNDPTIYEHDITSRLVRLTNVDYESIEWLSKNSPQSSIILAGPLDKWLMFYLQSRAVITDIEHGFSPILNNPNDNYSMKVILDHNISYIFVRPKPTGWIPSWIPDDSWDYTNEYELSKSQYLDRIFTRESNGGNISIYQVNQVKLSYLLYNESS